MKTTSIAKVLLFSLSMLIIACQPPESLSTAIPLTNTSTSIPISSPTEVPSPTITPLPTATLAPETDFIKGVWFVDWGLGPGVFTVDGKHALAENVIPLGAKWIALQVPCQVNVKSPSNIVCNYDNSLPLSGLRMVTETAHSLGLRVALFASPLDVEGVPGNWSAALDYGSNQQKWDDYFAAYTKNLLSYAAIAEELQIDLLIIGGEQTGTQRQEAHWRAVVEQVRAVYHGPITYEAWCDTFDTVKWWDVVDYIGINFYCFPLSRSTHPSDEQVKASYLKFLKMVKDGTAKWNKQVIFTEIGYQSIDGVAQIVPFGLTPPRLDVDEQGILVKNFFEAFKDFGNEDQWLKGLFWYNFTSSPNLGGMGDLNFTPHNKPAEVYIRAFYTGQQPGPLPTLPAQVNEDKFETSYWIFSDKLENETSFGPWAGKGQAEIGEDPLRQRESVIKVKVLGHWDGLHLNLSPTIDLRDYDYLELYLYAPNYEPNLELWFDDDHGQQVRHWAYIRSFIDWEPLIDQQWHRISIPLDLLYPLDRPDINSRTSAIYFIHMWPGEAGPFTFYLDDIRLVKASE